MNYASEIWGNIYVSRLHRLSVLQKRSIRLIENYKPRESSNPLFYKYKCLKFSDLIEFKTLIIIFKAKYNMLPENTQKLFKLCQDSHNYNTRHSVKGNFEVLIVIFDVCVY